MHLLEYVGLSQMYHCHNLKLHKLLNCETVVEMTSQHLRESTARFLQNLNVDINEETTVNFLNTFQYPDIFKNVSTYPKQAKFLQELAVDVPKPVEKMLAYREDVRHVAGQHTKVRVNETFSYIPIIDTLKLVLRNPSTRNLLTESELHHSSSPFTKEYSTYCSGETYKKSDYFKKFPDAVRLSLYQDDVELGNALSSRAGINKVSCFSVKIQNFPDRFNSSPKSIFPVIYCTSVDAKKHGYNKILQPLLFDLKKLENGVTIYYGSEKFELRAVLTIFCGDTLAVHEIFNLLGPGANFFCRICTISRPLYKQDPFEVHPLRTKSWYDDNLHLVKEGQILQSECGLKAEGCILNELQNFHVTENFALDVMHDLAEGIVPLTIQLVLSHYAKDKNVEINSSYVNYRISTFAYGYMDRKNKPSANITDEMLNKPNAYRLKQTSAQSFLLLRAFPFLFGHKLKADCPLMLLIGHLINITRILLSPIVSDYLLAELEEHIRLFQQLFYTNFSRRINKSHHLEHYVECIKRSGNMKQFNCLTFEQKNKPCKSQSATCKNFKNICKSLAKRQCLTMVVDIIDNPFTDKVVYKTGCLRYQKDCKSKAFIVENEDIIFTPRNVTINGIEFRPNVIVALKNSKELYTCFAVIREVVVKHNQLYFLVRICKTLDYNDFLEAYEVEVTDSDQFLSTEAIHQHATFAFWTTHNSNTQYISRRFYCQDY